jgi:CoA-transferase family III
VTPTTTNAHNFLDRIWRATYADPARIENIDIAGTGNLPSVFATSDLAAAGVAAAAAAVAELIDVKHGAKAKVRVDRRLASMWYGFSIRPHGWELPPPWDSVGGDYLAQDRWIRLHTNAPHHREVALTVLGVAPDKDAVAQAVAGWNAGELEATIVGNGGCAAAMYSVGEWLGHPQGRAVALEPLLTLLPSSEGAKAEWPIPRERPLAGIRVLDLTRVLAGPVATRFLAGFGADVLRIDPPGWDEPGVVPEVSAGKRCATLNLRTIAGRQQFEALLAQADIVVHGYRPEALERLGFDAQTRRALNPGLIDVSLDAYGWTGPWHARRGFDSLVQMSTGIADAGMHVLKRDRPAPLPVQALDQTAGYILAAAAVRGLTTRLTHGNGTFARTSLARVAALLTAQDPSEPGAPFTAEGPADIGTAVEETAWGPARRLKPPLTIDGAPFTWDRPAGPLGASEPGWETD